ncbi:DnaA/Hda family protein [Candidatus Pelagibacter sp.]|jgi:chromosomal replication initiation ATPase DnaA|nr:DnaA/Hda family protein [Candidatus Pelagibacter sp.]|tara:strand:+ start:1037 stop:1714 length:678 start_codon:yes stop_codon:yes gene_type:complete
MKNLNQLLLDFDYKQNFKDDDFYVGTSNYYPFELINKWPRWEKNFLNIIGERYSGKTHLVNIFLKKFKGIKINSNSLNNENLKDIKPHQNIILENFNLNIDEKLIYTLFNIIDQDSKFLIITSTQPIAEIKFTLKDLRSRTKNCLLAKIENPDDELMFALILKNLSDRQIIINKKLIDFIIKRVERSYGKIFEFIYKIDKISLKKKKSIDFKIINEVLKDQSEQI